MAILVGYGNSLMHTLVEKAAASSPYRDSSVSSCKNGSEPATSPRRPLSTISPKVDQVAEVEEDVVDPGGHHDRIRDGALSQTESAIETLKISKHDDDTERQKSPVGDEAYVMSPTSQDSGSIEDNEKALAIALEVDHPTLLPENVASIITTASLAAKVSLRASALVIEALLETAKYSTSTTLNITRKSLISAVGAARALHYSAQGETWQPDNSRFLTTGNQEQDAFAGILERYSNLGIYLVHHVFTLTELFAMAGFSLTGTAVGMSFAAAEGSVALLDSMFGSNETSRALASFIALVRRETTEDDLFTLGKAGRFQIISGITKSLTAWVCLQNTLFYRIQAGHERRDRMKVIVDATVYEQDEDEVRESRENQQHVEMERHMSTPSTSRRQRASSEASMTSRPLSFRKQHRNSGFLMSEIANDPETLGSPHQTNAYLPDDNYNGQDTQYERRTPSRRNQSLATLASYDADPSQPASAASSIAPRRLVSYSDDENLDDVMENLESLLGPDDYDSNTAAPEDDVIAADVSKAIEALAARHRNDQDTSSLRQSVFEVMTTTETKTRTIVRTTSTLSGMNHAHSSPALARTRSLPGDTQLAGQADDDSLRLSQVESHHDLKTLSERSEERSFIDLPDINCTSRQSRILEHDEWIEFNTMMKRPEYRHASRDPNDLYKSSASTSNPQTPRNTHRPTTWEDSAQSSPDEQLSRGALSRRQSMMDPVGSSQRMQVVLNTVTKKVRRNKITQSAETASNASGRMDDTDWTERPDGGNQARNTGMQKILSKTGLRRLTKSSAVSSDEDQRNYKNGHSPRHSRTNSLEQVSPEKQNGVRGAIRKLRSKLDLTGRNRGTPELSNEVATPSSSSSSDLEAEFAEKGQKSNMLGNGHRSTGLSQAARPDSVLSRSKSSSKYEDNAEIDRKKDRPNFLKNSLSRTSMRSLRSTHTSSATVASASPNAYDESGNFPEGPLARSIARYMRWASASYGQAFMAVMGIGRANYYFPSDTRNHANVHAFAFHVGLHVDDILLSSFADPPPDTSETKLNPLVHYLGVDHASKAIVLACRGSLGLSDILVDLTCHDEIVEIPGGDPTKRYAIHAGMLASARQLCDSHSVIHEKIKESLLDYPEYGLVVTGHSLGGGVAAILALFWATPSAKFMSENKKHPLIRTPFVTSHESGLPPGRPVHSYVFGPPAIASSDLSRAMKGLVTSVVNGYDFIPTLSLGAIRDLKIVASNLWEDGDAAEEIVGRVVGSWQHRRSKNKSAGSNMRPGADSKANESTSTTVTTGLLDQHQNDPEPSEGTNVLWSFMSALRANVAEANVAKLYPGGRVLIIESYCIFEPKTSTTSSSMKTEEAMTSTKNEKGSGKPMRSNSSQSARKFKRANRIFMKECLDIENRFGEILFRRDMFTNHSPAAMEKITSDLARAVLGTEW